MKRIKYMLLLSLSVGLFTACNKFLDISSDYEMLQDETFESQDGVHMYVNGVYRLLSDPSLYGRELTWGLVSVLGNNYRTGSNNLNATYHNASMYQWDYAGVESIMSGIWRRGYEVIANCNNIIQEVSKKDTAFFEFSEMEKAMILGEMYGLRAMVHFDILRLFAPAPVTNPSGLAMPYVAAFPEHQPQHKTVNEVLTSIIADMEKAKDMLAPVDTTFCVSWNVNLAGRIFQTSTYSMFPPNDFVSYRGMRMNYVATLGLLARIYMYKGDQDQAYYYASEALKYVEDKKWYTWTNSADQYSSTAVSQHPKRFNELMLCFSNNNSYDNWDAYTTGNANYLTMYDQYLNALFEGDEDDYRLRGMFGTSGVTGRYNNNNRWLVWERPQATASVPDATKDQGPLLPILRFSELYHIQIECLAQNRLAEAIALMNEVRAQRGCKIAIENSISKEELLNVLYKDIIRETLTEGQTFFMFKRLNKDIFNYGGDIKMEAQKWVAPLPQGETSYM